MKMAVTKQKNNLELCIVSMDTLDDFSESETISGVKNCYQIKSEILQIQLG